MGVINAAVESTINTPASGFVNTGTLSSDLRPRSVTPEGVQHILSQSQRNNYLRNGGFWFAQRQAPATATTYSNTTGRAICADGWGITNENASATYQRTDTSSAPETNLQSQFYGNFLKITTTGKVLVSQVVEGREMDNLRGRTVRFQCWLKAIVGTPIALKLSVIQLNSAGTVDTIPATFISAVGANAVDPTLGTNLAYLPPKTGVTHDNVTAGTNNVTASATTTWQRFGIVVDVPSNAKNLIVMVHSDSQVVSTNGFAMAQASLTDGFETQEWAPRDTTLELNRVQRFYQKTFAIDTAPAQNVGLLGAIRTPVTIAAAVATSIKGFWQFPIRMRSIPTTITFYNPSAANAFVRNVTGSTDATTTAAANQNDNELDYNCTGTAAWVVGDDTKVHCTVDAEL